MIHLRRLECSDNEPTKLESLYQRAHIPFPNDGQKGESITVVDLLTGHVCLLPGSLDVKRVRVLADVKEWS